RTASLAAAATSYTTVTISTWSSVTGSASSDGIVGARAPSSSTDFVPVYISASPELGYHFGGEPAHRRQHLSLRQRLHAIGEEVDAVDADRLPRLDLVDDPVGVADGHALGQSTARRRASLRRPTRRRGQPRQQLVGRRRVRLPGEEQVRVRHAEGGLERHAPVPRHRRVLVAVEEVECRHAVGDDLTHGVTRLDAAVVLLRAPLLLGVAGGGQADAAEAALGR